MAAKHYKAPEPTCLGRKKYKDLLSLSINAKGMSSFLKKGLPEKIANLYLQCKISKPQMKGVDSDSDNTLLRFKVAGTV